MCHNISIFVRSFGHEKEPCLSWNECCWHRHLKISCLCGALITRRWFMSGLRFASWSVMDVGTLRSEDWGKVRSRHRYGMGSSVLQQRIAAPIFGVSFSRFSCFTSLYFCSLRLVITSLIFHSICACPSASFLTNVKNPFNMGVPLLTKFQMQDYNKY